jgi:hypothetical protein
MSSADPRFPDREIFGMVSRADVEDGMSGELAEDLSIEALVTAVSEQLLRAQSARQASGRPAVFEVSDLTLEISYVVTQSKSAGGGFDLKVIKADGALKYDTESVQKVTLKLTAVNTQKLADNTFGKVRLNVTSDDSP